MRILLFGTFDKLHPGHQFILREAAARGEVFVVIARDQNVERIKSKKARQSEEERRAAVAAFLPSATVMLGDREDFLRPVREVQPDLIFLGYDQQLPPGVREEDLGAPVERLPAFQPEKYKSTLLE